MQPDRLIKIGRAVLLTFARNICHEFFHRWIIRIVNYDGVLQQPCRLGLVWCRSHIHDTKPDIIRT